MARVRLANQPAPEPKKPKRPARPEKEPVRPDPEPPKSEKAVVRHGLTERQWFIGLLVACGLLLLLTFRGCVLPSGVGPKSKPGAKPTSAPQATVQPAAAGEYTVERGDSLSKIADKLGVSLDTLLQTNDLNRSSILQVGQKLKIPPGVKAKQ
jgi:LysM repeat protein